MTDIDTGTTDLLATIEAGVGVLTFNRPGSRNALSRPMLEALARMLASFEVDDDIGAVVLTGAGGAFCAGGDVKAMSEGGDVVSDAGSPLDVQIHRQRLMQRATSGRLWSMPKPTIAAIDGATAGAGLSLALACDLRYASDRALLTTAFARVGFAGDFGGTWFLTQLVGTAKARELYYFSERVSASEAAALGLVHAVFPAGAFEAEVMAKARQLADGPRVAYRYMKENLNRSIDGDLGDCLDIEATHHIHSGLTEDHQDAAKAFVEKRPPQFRGR